jgi:hypothetical protein
MAGFSKYLAQQVLNHTLLNVPFPTITSHKIALFFADPVDTIQNEVIAPWYSRQTCDAWGPPTEVGTNGTASKTSNSITVSFGPVTGAGGTSISHWGIVDGLNSTNLLYSGTIDGTAANVFAGDTLTFLPGSLVVQLDITE